MTSDQLLDDFGQIRAEVGQAVEIVLALAAGDNDPAVAQQREVVTDGGLVPGSAARTAHPGIRDHHRRREDRPEDGSGR